LRLERMDMTAGSGVWYPYVSLLILSVVRFGKRVVTQASSAAVHVAGASKLVNCSGRRVKLGWRGSRRIGRGVYASTSLSSLTVKDTRFGQCAARNAALPETSNICTFFKAKVDAQCGPENADAKMSMLRFIMLTSKFFKFSRDRMQVKIARASESDV
jgi:hypothetical protein